MFLGHGALLRRKCWEEVGGFPHIVSEDLGFAIEIREKGYRGRFVEDVVCYEDFPDTVRAFRIRHMNGPAEQASFFRKDGVAAEVPKMFPGRRSWIYCFHAQSAADVGLLPLFAINANLVLPYFFYHSADV